MAGAKAKTPSWCETPASTRIRQSRIHRCQRVMRVGVLTRKGAVCRDGLGRCEGRYESFRDGHNSRHLRRHQHRHCVLVCQPAHPCRPPGQPVLEILLSMSGWMEVGNVGLYLTMGRVARRDSARWFAGWLPGNTN